MLLAGAVYWVVFVGSGVLDYFCAAVEETGALFPPVGGGPFGGAPGLDMVGGLPAGALTEEAIVGYLLASWFFQSSP